MPKATKETRIKKEKKRLIILYQDLPKNKMEILLPLIENAAFMRITLEELQDSINAGGCVEEYQHGKEQKGVKISSDIQAYNAIIKNYNAVIDRLEKLLPPEKKGSKLEKLMGS